MEGSDITRHTHFKQFFKLYFEFYTRKGRDMYVHFVPVFVYACISHSYWKLKGYNTYTGRIKCTPKYAVVRFAISVTVETQRKRNHCASSLFLNLFAITSKWIDFAGTWCVRLRPAAKQSIDILAVVRLWLPLLSSSQVKWRANSRLFTAVLCVTAPPCVTSSSDSRWHTPNGSNFTWF